MPASYSTAFSHLVLAGTGVYSYLKLGGSCRCPFGFNFSRCSFATIIVNSVIGVWRHGNPSYGDDAESLYKFTSLLQDLIVLPCVVSSLLTGYGYQDEIVFVSMMVPIIPLVTYLLDKKDVSDDLQSALVVIDSGILAYLSIMHNNYWGLAACASYLITHFALKKYDNSDIPAQDLKNYSMCFFTYFALRALAD